MKEISTTQQQYGLQADGCSRTPVNFKNVSKKRKLKRENCNTNVEPQRMMSRDFRDFRKGLFLNCNGKRGRVEQWWNCARKSTMCVRSPFFDDGDVLKRFAPTTLTLHKQDVIHHSSPLSSASWAELLFTLTTTAACILPWTGHRTIPTDKLIDYYSLKKILMGIRTHHRTCSHFVKFTTYRSFIHLLKRKACTCFLHSSIFCCGWFQSSTATDPEVHCIHCILPVQEVHIVNHAGFLHLLLAICNVCHRIYVVFMIAKMCCEKVSSVFVSLDVLLFLHLPLPLPLDQLQLPLGKENRLANLHSQISKRFPVEKSCRSALWYFPTALQRWCV